MRSLISIALLSVCSGFSFAGDPIPKEGGFSGFINLGVGAGQIESNMLAGIKSIDMGNDRIDSLGSPDGEDVVLPVGGFELSYTFAETRTQVFFGNLLEDYLRFDLTSRFGVRQGIEGVGNFSIEALMTPITTDTWEDPYVTGSKRRGTERSSTGVRVSWDRIMQTGLELRIAARELDVDDEHSGESLDLDAAERAMLQRTGDFLKIDLLWSIKLSEQSRLIPSLSYVDRDLDGDAMARSGYLATLSYQVNSGRFTYVTNVGFGKYESDETNPIFGKTDERDALAASFTLFYHRPFGWENWALNAGLAWSEEDSNMNFYDANATLASVGLLRRF
jgi:hypothetical protein